MKNLLLILILLSSFILLNSFEVTYRMRNTTKETYEYVTQEDSLACPTVLPDNPSDAVDQACTTIIINYE